MKSTAYSLSKNNIYVKSSANYILFSPSNFDLKSFSADVCISSLCLWSHFPSFAGENK